MFIREALVTYLLAQSGVTDYVGQNIFFAKARKNVTRPYIVIYKIDSPRPGSHETSDHLAHPRFQFSVFSDTPEEAENIVEALRSALQGYSGTMGGEGGVTVGAVFCDDETDLDPGQSGPYGIAADYVIWYSE